MPAFATSEGPVIAITYIFNSVLQKFNSGIVTTK
jgi:hypothetical protein